LSAIECAIDLKHGQLSSYRQVFIEKALAADIYCIAGEGMVSHYMSQGVIDICQMLGGIIDKGCLMDDDSDFPRSTHDFFTTIQWFGTPANWLSGEGNPNNEI
jgi:hypothetical protein